MSGVGACPAGTFVDRQGRRDNRRGAGDRGRDGGGTERRGSAGRDRRPGRGTGQASRKGPGRTSLALRLDVTDHAGFTAFLNEVERQFGPLDVLINNAGIMPLALLEEETEATTARQLAINLAAVIHGTREAIKRMKPRGRGHIVNIASAAGKFGAPGGATYSATKHGVVGLSEAVRGELRGTGVEISCVMPTIVRTELGRRLEADPLSSQVAARRMSPTAIVGCARPPQIRRVGASDARANPNQRGAAVLPRGSANGVARVGGADDLLASAAHSAGAGRLRAPRRGKARRATRHTGHRGVRWPSRFARFTGKITSYRGRHAASAEPPRLRPGRRGSARRDRRPRRGSHRSGDEGARSGRARGLAWMSPTTPDSQPALDEVEREPRAARHPDQQCRDHAGGHVRGRDCQIARRARSRSTSSPRCTAPARRSGG